LSSARIAFLEGETLSSTLSGFGFVSFDRFALTIV